MGLQVCRDQSEVIWSMPLDALPGYSLAPLFEEEPSEMNMMLVI